MSDALNELRDSLMRAGCAPSISGRELRAKCPSCGAGPDLFVASVNGRGSVVCECEAAGCSETEIMRALGYPVATDPGRAGFPVHALPSPMADLVREAAASVGVDPAMVAPHCLAVAAAAIGDTRCVRVKRDYIAPCVLWLAVIAPSGAGKTPAMRPVIRPLDDLQRDAHETHEANRQACGPDDDPPPPMEHLTIRNATFAAIKSVLTHNPRGVLCCPGELGEWLNSHNEFNRGKGTDTQAWLALHDGTAVQSNRLGDGATYIPSPRVSLCSTIQPSEAHVLLSGRQMGNGLTQRLLLCEPPVLPRVWSEREISAVTADAWHECIVSLRMLQPIEHENGRRHPIELDLSRDAKPIYVELFNSMNKRAARSSEALTSALSKMPDACARIALVLHLTDEAGRRLALETPTEISAESMRRAVEIVEWFADETERLYLGTLAGNRNADGLTSRQTDLLSYIDGKGGRVTARDLSRNKGGYKGEGGADRARADLQALADAGLGSFGWEAGEAGPGVDVFTLATATA